MDMQSQTSVVPASATKGVDIGAIEKQLSQMWQQTSDAARTANHDSGMTRACVLNLLVYASTSEQRAEIEAILGEVMKQNPCRALVLLDAGRTTEAKLETKVASLCRNLEGSVKQICGEQVTIEAGGRVVDSAASLLAPLLVPDVPVFLWWKDIPHYQDKLFDRMTELADRLVIDSIAFDHPHDDFLRLAQLLRERHDFALVTDLNWGRLTAWRTLIAGFWDVPQYRSGLDNINRVVIEYDPPAKARDDIAAKALLLIGWLASRLKWALDADATRIEDNIKCFTFKRVGDAPPVEVELRASSDTEAPDGYINALTLSNEAERARFYVAFSADGKKLQTEASIGDEHSVGRVLAYEARSEAQRLARELNFPARDTTYEAAIAAAAEMIKASKR